MLDVDRASRLACLRRSKSGAHAARPDVSLSGAWGAAQVSSLSKSLVRESAGLLTWTPGMRDISMLGCNCSLGKEGVSEGRPFFLREHWPAGLERTKVNGHTAGAGHREAPELLM